MKNRRFLVKVEYEDPRYQSVYDVMGNADELKLIYSEFDSGWTSSKGEAGSIKDHGNGVQVKLGDKLVELDYSEVEEIIALLKIHNRLQESSSRSRFKVAELI